jgi:hypothetical protein
MRRSKRPRAPHLAHNYYLKLERTCRATSTEVDLIVSPGAFARWSYVYASVSLERLVMNSVLVETTLPAPETSAPVMLISGLRSLPPKSGDAEAIGVDGQLELGVGIGSQREALVLLDGALEAFQHDLGDVDVVPAHVFAEHLARLLLVDGGADASADHVGREAGRLTSR